MSPRADLRFFFSPPAPRSLPPVRMESNFKFRTSIECLPSLSADVASPSSFSREKGCKFWVGEARYPQGCSWTPPKTLFVHPPFKTPPPQPPGAPPNHLQYLRIRSTLFVQIFSPSFSAMFFLAFSKIFPFLCSELVVLYKKAPPLWLSAPNVAPEFHFPRLLFYGRPLAVPTA